tara:strand:- start:374 stop:646 length:273 start_codon:yes stop_codon:yes gene_type:complete
MSKWRIQTPQEIEAEMEQNKMESMTERLCDKAYGLMLIWKQRIEHELTEEAQKEDPISPVYVKNLIHALRIECKNYGFTLDECLGKENEL